MEERLSKMNDEIALLERELKARQHEMKEESKTERNENKIMELL